MTGPDNGFPGSLPRNRAVVFDWTIRELWEEGSRFLERVGEPSYRLAQIEKWLYKRTPRSFSEMNDLPSSLRERLRENFILHPLRLELENQSVDRTRKFLWKRIDDDNVESVLIPDGKRITYCISSQAGCPVKCPFCATGYSGFHGQLSAAEIVDQVLQMRAITNQTPTNVVFMGMGEPLLNYEATARALRILTHPKQLGLGPRRITVSTVGLPHRIRELTHDFPQVKLAISLHAARNDLRDELVPLNKQYPLEVVLDAVRDATKRTGRTATMEYVILPGVNDTTSDVEDIIKVLRGIPSRINLIGYNPFPGGPYEKPRVRQLLCFRDALKSRFPGPVTLRRARGEDIQGACGQLSLRS